MNRSRPIALLAAAALAAAELSCSSGDIAPRGGPGADDVTVAPTPGAHVAQTPSADGMPADGASPARAPRRYRGVGWVAGGEITIDHLRPLVTARGTRTPIALNCRQ